jgi:hypothetical protein
MLVSRTNLLASINLQLSAIRKLAAGAAENDLLDRSVAQGIVSLKGAQQSGDRAGNWLSREPIRQTGSRILHWRQNDHFAAARRCHRETKRRRRRRHLAAADGLAA